MSNGPLASSKINSEKKKGNNSVKKSFFSTFLKILFYKVTFVATMLDTTILTLIVFSQLICQIYKDFIENTQKGHNSGKKQTFSNFEKTMSR